MADANAMFKRISKKAEDDGMMLNRNEILCACIIAEAITNGFQELCQAVKGDDLK